MPPLPRTRPWPRILAVLALLLAAGCARPGATRLPSAEAGIGPGQGQPEYEVLTLEGVKGGRLRFTLAGTVEDVLDMLLDFDHAAGHRPWAETYRTVSRSSDRVVAEWAFRGKLGVRPRVRLEFVPERRDDGAVVRYRVVQKAFGIAAFFGDYRLQPLAGVTPRVQVTSRIFIDSGLWFANASRQDIEKGLRTDARKMRQWMLLRLAPDSKG